MPTVRKLFFTIALLLGLSSNAWAMKTPMFGTGNTAPSTSVTQYMGFNSNPQSTDAQGVRTVLSMNGIVEGLYVMAGADPGGTASYTYTLQKNGSVTSVTCTIPSGSTTCSSSGSFSASAGDSISLKIVPTNTPNSGVVTFSTMFNSGSSGGALIYSSANNNNASASAEETINVQGRLGWSQGSMRTIVPTSGTISGLYILQKTAPGSAASGKQYVYTVQLNSVDTSLTCTVFETAMSCNDTVHSFSVVPGDSLRLHSTPSGTPATGNPVIGLVFTPTIDGESFYSAAYQNAYSASSDTYIILQGYLGSAVSTTTEAGLLSVVIPQSGIQARKIAWEGVAAPGASKSVTIALRNNSSTTSLACTATGASATTCLGTSSANYVTLAAGDLINYVFSPTGTPTVGSSNRESVVLYVDPQDTIYGADIYGATIN